MAPIRDYVTMLRQLGARTSIQLCEYRAPRGGPTLFDEESSDDGIQMRSQQPDVGDESLSRKYIAAECTTPIPADGEVPRAFTKCVIAGHEADTNDKARSGSEWHSDGSKLICRTDHGDYSRAGCSRTCGPLIVIARITGPQTSYRAELQPRAMLTQLRNADDTLTLDNQAVVRWCQTEPRRECAHRDLRDFIYSHTQGNPIPMRWIPGHQELTQACTKQDREDIRRNNEVDRWAKNAAGLSLPNVDPNDVSHVVIGGGACAYPCMQMDCGLPEYPRFPRSALDHLVTPEGHAPTSLAHLAPGQREMGSLRRAMGKASSKVPAMWAVPWHHRAPAPRFLPSMAALLHQPMDPLLG